MQRLFVFVISLALREIVCGAFDVHGYHTCPCITPTPTNWCASSHRAASGGQCYPLNFGAGSCLAHDANLSSECVSNSTSCSVMSGAGVACSTSSAAWCGAKWCWVNASTCKLPNSPSSFFPGSSLHYSYETCGNLNQYDKHKFVKLLQSARPLRISFPGSSGSGYTIVRDGPPGYKGLNVNNGTNRMLGEFGRLGSTVAFFDAVWKSVGLKEYDVVQVSDSSAKRFPKSSFSACVHELALHRTDACVGNFWPTADRRLLASFTSAIYQDTFHIVVPKKNVQATTLMDKLLAWYKLFETEDWLLILGFLLYAALAIWLIEGASNEQDFPEKGQLDGIRRSIWTHLQCFVGMGDHRFNPHTSHGRVVVLMTSFVILFVVTQITANMTVEGIATSKVKGTFTNLDDVVNAKGMICGLSSNKNDFLQRYQQVGKLNLYKDFKNADAALQAMNNGECVAAIVTEDEWQLRKRFKENCDKVMLEASLLSKPNAFAVRDDLVAPFSWAMTKLQNQGSYVAFRDAAVRDYVDQRPDACASASNTGDGKDLESAYYITGPIILAFAVITASLVSFVISDCLRSMKRKCKIRNKPDASADIFRIPPLRERLFGRSSGQREKRKSSREALVEVHAENNDLKMINTLFVARHFTEERINKKIKGDSPITVSDVPVIVHLVKKAVMEEVLPPQRMDPAPALEKTPEEEEYVAPLSPLRQRSYKHASEPETCETLQI